MPTQVQTQPEPIVSINVPLPMDLHRRVKMTAASEGITVKQAVIHALEMWVVNG